VSRTPFGTIAALAAEMDTLVGWDAETQSYKKLKRALPGIGFWLKVGKGFAVVKGQPVSSKKITLKLGRGWNLIGNPYQKPIPVEQLKVQLGETTYTVPQAIKQKIFLKSIQGYTKGEFFRQDLSKGMILQPWQGYWLHVTENCDLIVSESPLKVDGNQRKETKVTLPVKKESNAKAKNQ
jgi:hypothetical protein